MSAAPPLPNLRLPSTVLVPAPKNSLPSRSGVPPATILTSLPLTFKVLPAKSKAPAVTFSVAVVVKLGPVVGARVTLSALVESAAAQLSPTFTSAAPAIPAPPTTIAPAKASAPKVFSM